MYDNIPLVWLIMHLLLLIMSVSEKYLTTLNNLQSTHSEHQPPTCYKRIAHFTAPTVLCGM
jgi:hypothetical protein